MGVDTHLYVSTDYSLEEIKAVIERTQKCKVKIQPCKDSPNYYDLIMSTGRQIFCHTPTDTPIGNATYLKLHADNDAHKIFRDIAEVLGGLFQPYDYNDKCELIQGKLWKESELPYFLRYAIINDGIEPDDLQGLLNSIKKWYGRIKPNDKDSGIYQLANKLG